MTSISYLAFTDGKKDKNMLLSSLLFVGLATLAAAVPSASSELGNLADSQLVKRQRGGGGRFSTENWTDGTAKVNCKPGSGGSYSVSWTGNKGNFVCGEGYNTADAK